jgi:hypothetical protein
MGYQVHEAPILVFGSFTFYFIFSLFVVSGDFWPALLPFIVTNIVSQPT